jgi:acyl transferase domain-containing protein
MAHRGFAILDQNGGLSDFELSHEAPSSISFVFSGQGAQWAGMGKELLSTSACFLKSIQTMDGALKQLANPPSWTLEGNVAQLVR